MLANSVPRPGPPAPPHPRPTCPGTGCALVAPPRLLAALQGRAAGPVAGTPSPLSRRRAGPAAAVWSGPPPPPALCEDWSRHRSRARPNLLISAAQPRPAPSAALLARWSWRRRAGPSQLHGVAPAKWAHLSGSAPATYFSFSFVAIKEMLKLSGTCGYSCGFVGRCRRGERLERWRWKTTATGGGAAGGRKEIWRKGEEVKNLVILGKNRLGWCRREELAEDGNRKSCRELEQKQRLGATEEEHTEGVCVRGLGGGAWGRGRGSMW